MHEEERERWKEELERVFLALHESCTRFSGVDEFPWDAWKKKRWRLHASIYGDCTSCSELDNPLHVTRGVETRRNGSQEDSDPERERERSRLRLVNNSVRIKVVARAPPRTTRVLESRP